MKSIQINLAVVQPGMFFWFFQLETRMQYSLFTFIPIKPRVLQGIRLHAGPLTGAKSIFRPPHPDRALFSFFHVFTSQSESIQEEGSRHSSARIKKQHAIKMQVIKQKKKIIISAACTNCSDSLHALKLTCSAVCEKVPALTSRRTWYRTRGGQ